jgi:hypothetical protein
VLCLMSGFSLFDIYLVYNAEYMLLLCHTSSVTDGISLSDEGCTIPTACVGTVS